jgi:hypothetical protein
MFVCTDNTSGANVWKGVEASTDPVTWSFQGSNYGYYSGGYSPSITTRTAIEKFSFSTDGNATNVGDLSSLRWSTAGQSSADYGYVSGGGTYPLGTADFTDSIDKFSFSTDGNATNVGSLATTATAYLGGGNSSANYGYVSGGLVFDTSVASNVIQKFSFSSDGNSTDVGDLTEARRSSSGQSSSDYGYNSGGLVPGYVNTVDKFSFATDGNATDVGDLLSANGYNAGQSSTDYGYASGGVAPPRINVIQKFPFAADANATDVGDLLQVNMGAAGQSSTDYGYVSGGLEPQYTNVIQKFPFSSDGNSTDVGDLTEAVRYAAGQQY